MPVHEHAHCGGSVNRKTPHSDDLGALLATLPPGQRRVAEALVGGGAAVTYPAVAAVLGVHVATMKKHLTRIRKRRPAVYGVLMGLRRAQLAQRHREALARQAAHSEAWARRKSRFMYWVLHGHPAPAWWPPQR